jgi:hypothetical protein
LLRYLSLNEYGVKPSGRIRACDSREVSIKVLSYFSQIGNEFSLFLLPVLVGTGTEDRGGVHCGNHCGKFRPLNRRPLLPRHAKVSAQLGIVEETGKDLTNLRRGDRAVVPFTESKDLESPTRFGFEQSYGKSHVSKQGTGEAVE